MENFDVASKHFIDGFTSKDPKVRETNFKQAIKFYTIFITNILGDYEKRLRSKRDECVEALVFAFFNRGRTYQKLKQYEKAIEDYNWGIKNRRVDSDFFYRRGSCLMKLGRLNEALVSFKESMKIMQRVAYVKGAYVENKDRDEKEGKIYWKLGMCYLDLRQFKLAFSSFKKIKKKSNDQYYNLAYCCYQGKDYLNAVKYYTQAIQFSPEGDVESYRDRADCNFFLKNWKAAINDYKFVISKNKTSTYTHLNIGECYYNLKMYDLATKHFTKEMEWRKENLKKENPCITPKGLSKVCIYRGDAHRKAGRYKEAISDFSISIRFKSELPLSPKWANYGRGFCYYFLNQNDMSKKDLFECLKCPKFQKSGIYMRNCLIFLANMFINEKKLPEAIKYFSKGVTICEEKLEFLFYRAIAFEKVKNYASSLLDYAAFDEHRKRKGKMVEDIFDELILEARGFFPSMGIDRTYLVCRSNFDRIIGRMKKKIDVLEIENKNLKRKRKDSRDENIGSPPTKKVKKDDFEFKLI